MRILLTGGCGFVGHHMVEHFLKNTNWQIIILDRLTYASMGLTRLRDIKVFNEDRVKVFILLSEVLCELKEFDEAKKILNKAVAEF